MGASVIQVPTGEFATVFESRDRLGGVYVVNGEMFDHGHVLRAVAGLQAGEIVTEA